MDKVMYIPNSEIIPQVDLSGIDPTKLSPQELRRMLALTRRLNESNSRRKLDFIFPATGPFARHLYPKHMAFFRTGSSFPERCFMAANRTGKTFAGAFEMTLHLTGLYPDWWAGKRFDRPITAWAAGDTKEDTRDILQVELFGKVLASPAGRRALPGTGTVPARLIGRVTWKRGASDAVDTVRIKHVSGGWSELGFKSFQQGRKAFQGVKREVIWLDEEASEDIYGECLMRTATTGGIIMLTFTPLQGLTPLVMGFLPKNYRPSSA